MSGGCGPYSEKICTGLLPGANLRFMAQTDTLPSSLAFHAPAFASSKKQILKNYHEVHMKMLEDAAQLAT
jgi:hypothetical protein